MTSGHYAPARRKGSVSVAFVHLSVGPSVRQSVAYIANNSRTQRPSVPKFEMKVPYPRCESRASFKVKRSKVTVTRLINADTHPAPYLPNANLPHAAGCCCWGNVWRISRPFSISICTKLARNILMRDRNIVTEPENCFLNLEFYRQNSYLSISAV